MPALPSRPPSSNASETVRSGQSNDDTASSATQSRRSSIASQQKTSASGQVQKTSGQLGGKPGRELSREKPPSKDGAAQRAAAEVAGLKDYVRWLPLSCLLRRSRDWRGASSKRRIGGLAMVLGWYMNTKSRFASVADKKHQTWASVARIRRRTCWGMTWLSGH